MQRLPELVDAETTCLALLARPTSGGGEEDLVTTCGNDSRVRDGDGRECTDCTTQDGFDELVGRLRTHQEWTTLSARSPCRSRR